MILGTSASFYIYSKDDISDLFIINDLQRMFYFTLSQNEEGYLSPSIFIKSTEYNKTLVDSEINALSMLVMLMHPDITIGNIQYNHGNFPYTEKKPTHKIHLDETDVFLKDGIRLIRKNLIPEFFEGFSKIIEWMDVKKGKPASRFCKIRDVIAHPATDRAYKKI